MAHEYQDLSTKDLAEIYNTTKENYGKIEGALLDEINRRGGEEAFLSQSQKEKLLKVEKLRIIKEVTQLMRGHQDPEIVKKMIQSDFFTKHELSHYIDDVSRRVLIHRRNITVDRETVWGCLIGTIIGIVLGFVITTIQILYLFDFFYFSLVLIYLLSWIVLYLITKKNAANLAVFISAIVATIVGPVLAFWIHF